LLGDEVVAAQHAFNLAPQERRQWTTITGPHCVETFPEIFSDAFSAEPDPVQGQKPFDAPHDADALFHQVLSFALDTLRIFLLDARNLYISFYLTIARQPGAQCPRHALSIEAIGLGETATSRHQEAGRVKNKRSD